MITTADPSDMTPEERRAEVAAILAAGFLRLNCRPAQPPAPRDETHGVADPPCPPAASSSSTAGPS
jgi:hypothetical protein